MITELLRRRTKLGISQSEVCRRSKVCPSDYGRLEKGKESPWSNGQWSLYARRLSSFYGCDPEDLFRPWRLEIPTDPQSVFQMVESQNPYQVDPSYFQLQKQIHCALKTLTPREEKVVRMRFGIGELDYTLEEIGDDFEVNRERIRQIEAKALRKLRHPSRCKRLKAFADGEVGPFQVVPQAYKVFCHRCGEPFYRLPGDGRYCQGKDCWSDRDDQRVHYKRNGDTILGEFRPQVYTSDVSALNQKRLQRWEWYQRCRKLQATLKKHPETEVEAWYPTELPTNVFDVTNALKKYRKQKAKILEKERKEQAAENARRQKEYWELQAQKKALREAEEQEYRRRYPELVAAKEREEREKKLKERREIRERAKRMKLFIHRNGHYCQPFSIIVNGERILETSVSTEWLSAVRDGDIKILYKGVPMGEVEAPEESSK